MNSPLQIGITGGIGSGKSLVCQIFHCLGIPIYDADSQAKKLMTTDAGLISNIKKEFGVESYNVDGNLNRSYISQQVFKDANKLNLLNSLVHPRVSIDYNNWVQNHKDHNYIIKEAALLFEAKSKSSLHKIIVVYATQMLRVKRVLQRDAHRTEEQIIAIISNQMPEEEKRNKADYVILNDEVELIIPQVLKLHNLFSHRPD